MPGWVSLQNHIGQNRTIIQIPIGKVFITILCYQLITSNANKIHTNQHMLSHDVYWLHGCSVGVWWLAYRCSYHLFQCSQRYCSCCFLIVVGHFTFRAQLVVVQKVRSTITGLNCYLWLLLCLVGCLLVAVTFFKNGLSALFFKTNL